MANRMCLRWFGMNTKGALGDDANSGKVHMLDRTTIITDTGRGGGASLLLRCGHVGLFVCRKRCLDAKDVTKLIDWKSDCS